MVKVLCDDGTSKNLNELISTSGGLQSGLIITNYDGQLSLMVNPQHKIGLYNFETGPSDCILMTNMYGTPEWVPVDNALVKLMKNPLIRNRVENLIKAQKDLEMAMKLVDE